MSWHIKHENKCLKGIGALQSVMCACTTNIHVAEPCGPQAGLLTYQQHTKMPFEMFMEDIIGKNTIISDEGHFHFTHESSKSTEVISRNWNQFVGLSVYCVEMSVSLHHMKMWQPLNYQNSIM